MAGEAASANAAAGSAATPKHAADTDAHNI